MSLPGLPENVSGLRNVTFVLQLRVFLPTNDCTADLAVLPFAPRDGSVQPSMKSWLLVPWMSLSPARDAGIGIVNVDQHSLAQSQDELGVRSPFARHFQQ